MPSNHVIDTYSWVEYLRGSKAGAKAKTYIEGGGAITPSIVLAELRKWFLREMEAGRRSERDMRQVFTYVETMTEIVPLDASLALKAGELDFMMKKRIKGWPLADSIIYATAREYAAKVVSGDPHFKDLEDVVFIG
ncbi:MAG: type II toxin-antitoxin system VapC family toxin [Candidatus Caldarchaeum sp.]